VTWTPPSQNTDGTSLTNAASYRIDFGLDANALDRAATVSNGAATTATITGLSAGTYYFAVTAVNSGGVAGVRSSTVSRTFP